MNSKGKIAVVTLYGEFNFGNRLQNYAIHKYITKLGFEVETIVVKERESLKKRCIYIVKDVFVKLFPSYVLNKKPHWQREKKFKNFTKNYIRTRYVRSKDGKFPKSISNEYKYFIAGSDQIWNPTFGGYEKYYHNMFLLFTSSEKKICFSPSIGITDIPIEWRERFSEGFKTFHEISVREEAGAKVINELSGKSAEVLIDPTLMLDADEWETLSVKSNIDAKKYVFEYFLGEFDSETENVIISEVGKDMKKINIFDPKNREIYASGPSEFIDMIKNAAIVCTDSFHACVFSIIFDVPFIIMKRKGENQNMYSRIDTLLKMFDVNYECGKPVYIDKSKKLEVIKRQRSKVDEYFKKCINGGKGNVH